MNYEGIIIEKTDVNFTFINPVTVVLDFDYSKPVGKATVYKEGDLLKADFDVKDGLEGRYPAIGYQYDKGRPLEGKIFAIGLCVKQNVDETIEPLKAP